MLVLPNTASINTHTQFTLKKNPQCLAQNSPGNSKQAIAATEPTASTSKPQQGRLEEAWRLHYGTHVMQLCIFKEIKRLCNNCMSKMYAYSNSNRKEKKISQNKPLVQLKQLSREKQKLG